ncbi:hypothetical protein GCM10027418_17690 [Mariniluteicoccus endophyticus]
MNEQSRFNLVSRRRMLALAAFGAVGAVVGCSNTDSTALSTPSSGATTGSNPSTPSATASQSSSAKATAGTGGTQLPASAKAAISFTFAASSSGGGGRGGVKNPYIAVWVEDANGALVKAIAVWYEQGKGERWLPDLKRWASVSDSSTTATGATRQAGSYNLQWDGTNDALTRVAAGDYYLCLEGAREHGQYELIREKVTFGTSAFDKQLPASGELTAASLRYTV